jgi:hypothetical protein
MIQAYTLYLGQFDINYIIFKNAEIFKNYFFQIKKFVKDTSEYLKIFHFLKWFFEN